MSDDLIVRPGPIEPRRGLAPARPRRIDAAPSIVADRDAILAELDRKADESPRYADWPETVPGVPIGFLPGAAGPLCYNLDTHRLVLGRSGGGKATAAISYMLLHDDGHAVVMVDPKNGSIARATAGYRQRLGPVHIVDPYNMTGFFADRPCAHFNPFDALDPHSVTLVEDAAGLASALCYLPGGGGDDHRYWDRQARSFTTALILHIVTAPGEVADLLRLRELLTLPLTDDPDHPEAESFLTGVVKPMQANPACGGTVRRYGQEMERHVLGNRKGFEDIFATIRSYVPWIEFQQLRAVTAQSTFDFGEVRERGGTVYIVMDDDRLDDCASWLRLMLESARLGLKRTTDRRPVHFVIDEAAALGKLDLITTGLRAWRSAGIRLHLFYQDVGQIKAAFKDGWSSIANTDVLQFMGSNPGDVETAEFISKIFGERDMIVPTAGDSATSSTGTTKSTAEGTSETKTDGTSATRSTSVTRTLGSSWSTAIGKSTTIADSFSSSSSSSTTVGSSTAYTSNGPQTTTSSSSTSSYSESHSHSESNTRSRTDTTGGSDSDARGKSNAEGTSRSVAKGSTDTNTTGTSQSEAVATNRSFTLQLRRTLRPEQVRMLPEDQMIVIAGDREPALVHKEHFYSNPRLVARAMLRYDPSQTGPVEQAAPAAISPKQPAAKGSLLGALASIFLPDKRR